MDPNSSLNKYMLITSSNFPSGGAGAAYLNLFCKGIALNGRSIKVYMTKGYALRNSSKRIPKKNKTNYGVEYSHLGFANRPENPFLKTLDDFLSMVHLLLILPSLFPRRKETTLVVYLMDFAPSILVYLTAGLFKCRIVTLVPEYFNKKYYLGFTGWMKWQSFIFILNKLNPMSDKLIVFSNYLKEIYLKKGFKEGKILIQPNLTDFEFWNSPQTVEKYTIGYSGTPGGKDGLIYLFQAIKILKDQMPISLLVVGDSPFGKSMIPNLESLCEKMEIRDLVTFTGLVEYEIVKEYISQCRIAAITRPNDIQTQAGFPTKLGEYMALKKPVLATDFGDVKLYFSDGEEIVLAESCEPQSIADKIRGMVQNKVFMEKVGLNGYNKAYQLLEYKMSMARVIDFMDGL